ncbi:MAG: hypothetical protein LAN83_17555 [Acidobacteriia bacterium]|nr:hypothetical protein [Terriglobia bacterium]
MIKRIAFVVALAVLISTPLLAQRVPTGLHARGNMQFCAGKGSKLVYTNLTGPLHHKFNNTTGYFVDGSNFNNQVIAQGFTPTSTVTFADAYIPMAVYTLGGGDNNPGELNVYLESDAGGAPGSILEGPLTACNGISNFNNGIGGNFVEFNCTSCNTTLNAGTPYWIVAQEGTSTVELTWDEVRGITDVSSPFAFNQTGNPSGDWNVVPSGYSRSAYEVDGN